jgi:hypothetical protein
MKFKRRLAWWLVARAGKLYPKLYRELVDMAVAALNNAFDDHGADGMLLRSAADPHKNSSG